MPWCAGERTLGGSGRASECGGDVWVEETRMRMLIGSEYVSCGCGRVVGSGSGGRLLGCLCVSGLESVNDGDGCACPLSGRASSLSLSLCP